MTLILKVHRHDAETLRPTGVFHGVDREFCMELRCLICDWRLLVPFPMQLLKAPLDDPYRQLHRLVELCWEAVEEWRQGRKSDERLREEFLVASILLAR